MPNTIFDLSLTELVDQMMRSNYQELIHHVGRNIFPLIVAQDDADRAFALTPSCLRIYI